MTFLLIIGCGSGNIGFDFFFFPPQYLSAQKEFNRGKNRSSDLVPVEGHRIPLAPKPGTEGSDYINASWLNGHNKLREFIISQHPIDKYKVTVFYLCPLKANALQMRIYLQAVDGK